MKKFFAGLFLATTLLFSAGFAQISDCSITYKMDMDGPEMDAMAKTMMANATTTISFKGTSARVATKMMMGETVIVTTENPKKSIVLMDMMGMKIASDATDSNEDNAANDGSKIKKTGKTKDIAGYKCEELIVTPVEGDPITLWVTDKISPKSSATDYQYKGVNGFPLEMTTNQEGTTVKLQAQKVSTEKLDDALFSTEIPSGYKIMTQEEMMQMGGGQ